MGKFKDLRVWRDAMDLAELIYQVTQEGAFSKDFGLRDQIQRAAVSVPSNISEGDERGTIKEAIYFFNVAKGSVAEVITQLNLAHRIGYLSPERFETLENLGEKVRASLKNLIKSRRARGGR